MQKSVTHRQRGTAIAFLLMAVIAVLAIVVVLISRARRENHNLIEPPIAEEVTTGTETTSTDFTTSAPDQAISPTVSENFQGAVPPPPPPPPPTPNHRDLPPEG